MITTLAIDSLPIMGPTADPIFWVNKFKGIGSAPPRNNRPNRARRHGAIEMSDYYEPRIFEFDLWLISDDWASMWTAFDVVTAALAVGSGPQVLTFTRSGLAYTEFSTVTLDKDVEPRWPYGGAPTCVFEGITMVAGDPRLYGTALETANLTSDDYVPHTGTFNTPLIFTFNGAGVNPGLGNSEYSNDNEFHLNYTMGGGDVVEVDTAAKTIKLNGALRPDIVDSDTSSFWKLVAGPNYIQLLGGATDVDLSWYPAWM